MSLTSREFNQDVSAAKRAAADGPVVVTSNGEPTHVLLTIDDFKKLEERAGRLSQRLHDPATSDVDLPLPARAADARPVDP